MTSPGREVSSEEKEPTTQATKRDQTVSPEEKHRAADEKSLRLEHELDVLLHWADSIRAERTALTKGQPENPNDPQKEATARGRDQLIERYLALAETSKDLNAAMKTLKEECAFARSECNYLYSKVPKSSSRFKHGLYDAKTSLAQGGAESGFIDRVALAERILVAESTAYNVGGVVGAFGAGLAYTTLFSAARGRLDLIAWAYTSFVVVVVNCAALQLFAQAQHSQIAKIFRMEYSGSAEQKLFFFVLLVGLPMVTGFFLLGMSVALLDAAADSVPGSQIAIRAAGYLPVAHLGYFVIAMIVAALGAVIIRIVFLRGNRRNKDMEPADMSAESRKYHSSMLFIIRSKLHFLPGGPGYSHYRQRRLERAESKVEC